jgi:hypothetical protein
MSQECPLTFFFQEDATLCNHDGHITVDVTLAFVVEERNCNIGVTDRGVQRDAKNARCCCYAKVSHYSDRRNECAAAQLITRALAVSLHEIW